MQPNAVWGHAQLVAEYRVPLPLVGAAHGQQGLVLPMFEATCLYHSWEVSSLHAGGLLVVPASVGFVSAVRRSCSQVRRPGELVCCTRAAQARE